MWLCSVWYGLQTSFCLQSVEGMKVLCFELMEAAAGRASAYTLANLAASANELVIELTNRVHQVRVAAVTCTFSGHLCHL